MRAHGTQLAGDAQVGQQLDARDEAESEHFREYRLRAITERLEAMPELIDRL